MKARRITVVILGILLFSLLAGAPVLAQEVVVIANGSVGVDRLDRGTVSDIYRGNKTSWDDGEIIRVAMLKGGETHETFVRDIVGVTPAQLKNLWKKVIFTGTGRPPKVFKTEADLAKFVASTRGAIGYVDSATPHEDVKVIAVK